MAEHGSGAMVEGNDPGATSSGMNEAGNGVNVDVPTSESESEEQQETARRPKAKSEATAGFGTPGIQGPPKSAQPDGKRKSREEADAHRREKGIGQQQPPQMGLTMEQVNRMIQEALDKAKLNGNGNGNGNDSGRNNRNFGGNNIVLEEKYFRRMPEIGGKSEEWLEWTFNLGVVISGVPILWESSRWSM